MEPSQPARYSIISSLGGKTVIMSSTLVETVSINYEDFSESFLTCSTCLCTYDGGEHVPKLLFCSHTVCLHCLVRIVQSTQTRNESRTERDTPDTFRCPICRETIPVPRGGVSALPPSFLVNQLLDLMARQRREVVPKCAVHPSQELLFCESCDTVFCSHCTAGSHGDLTNDERDTLSINNSSLTDHTVVPFSIAIKRMSEILLYKANEIAAKLVQAEESVSTELHLLELSKTEALREVENAYESLEKCLRRAKEDALTAVTQLANRKSQMLLEQLDLIKSERSLVERDVNGMQYQIEVRSLSDRIATLQEKLEGVSTLAEPRENSFLIYEIESSGGRNSSQLEKQLEDIVSSVGRPRTSTTLPSLCTVFLSGSSGSMTKACDRQVWATNQGICGGIEAVDYHGYPRREGCDPMKVVVEDSDNQLSIPCSVIDVGNGTYRFWFRVSKAQIVRVRATLFGRPLKNSPLTVEVLDHRRPLSVSGSKGSQSDQFIQPSGIAVWNPECHPDDSTQGSAPTIYVLDSGNQRIAKYSQDLRLIGYLTSPAVEGRSATGVCLARSGSSPGNCLWVANWKTRSVMEVSTEDGHIIRTVTFPFLREPVDVSVNSQGQLLIADAEQSTVFIAGVDSGVICQCGSVGTGQGQFLANNLRAVTCASNDEVVAADCTKIQIFSKSGQYLRTLSTTISKGLFGGLVYDGFDHLLVSYVENAKSKGSRCGIFVIRYSTDEVLFNFDAVGSNLRRPGRLCCASFNQEILRSVKGNDQLEAFQSGYIYVTDEDSIKKYRYL